MLIARLQLPMCTSPVLAPALTPVLIFTVVFPFLEDSKLIVRPRLALASTASVYFAVEPMMISPVPPPALTFVLIIILVFSFLENLFEVDCGEYRRLLVKWLNRAGY